MDRRRRERRRRLLLRWLIVFLVVVVVIAVLFFVLKGCGDDQGSVGDISNQAAVGTGTSGGTGTSESSGGSESSSTTETDSSTTTASGSTTSATGGETGVSGTAGLAGGAPPVSPNTTVAVAHSGQPGDKRIPGSFYGPIQTEFEGLSMFRGNASRTYYGEGPVPENPSILWKFGPMSGTSTNLGKTTTWTGTGWTGQPAVFERDGKTWVVFGAYDWKIHFLDATTGDKLLPDFKGGDIFKGSPVIDPDTYPLVYMGCRDNKWRIIAIDRDEPTELFNLNADELPNQVWNDDWDSSVVIRNDYAFVGGENSHFYILKLNRGYNAEGKVTVDPEIVLDHPAWTQSLLDKLGSKDVSVENSPCLVGDRVYFSNSGGLVQGLDVSATLKELAPSEKPAKGQEAYPKVFSYWTGDDTDASIVADEQGFIYVCQHMDDARGKSARAEKVGQIIKLDPRKTGEGQTPLVWSVEVTKMSGGVSGVWATPAIYKDMLYVPTHGGALLGIDRETGEIVWQKEFSEHAWGSPVVVDGTLILGDTYGTLHAYDVSNTNIEPPVVWEFKVPTGSALESTAAVWKGAIYMGSRDGYFYKFGDQ